MFKCLNVRTQVKDDWPPTKPSAIETIAASYNPVPKVRII